MCGYEMKSRRENFATKIIITFFSVAIEYGLAHIRNKKIQVTRSNVYKVLRDSFLRAKYIVLVAMCVPNHTNIRVPTTTNNKHNNNHKWYKFKLNDGMVNEYENDKK